MALYSVHLQDNALNSIAEAAFVRQAFSWKAFLFGPLWLICHRLWVPLAAWTGAYLLLIAASSQILSSSAVFFIGLALQILLGLEANRLREEKLAGQGYHIVEIIAAPARDEAEIAFYRQIEVPDVTFENVASTQGGARS
jgi:hypothetical protein